MIMIKHRGFTLVELMIVVAIIGVISAIAFPSYTSYMKKSRRADAIVALTKLADKQERFYLQNNTYTTSFAAAGLNTLNISADGFYDLTIPSGDASGFTVKAVAVAGKAQATDTDTTDGDCATSMSLDSTGLKLPADCW